MNNATLVIINYEPITPLKLHEPYTILFLLSFSTIVWHIDPNLNLFLENDIQAMIKCCTCHQSTSAACPSPSTPLSTSRAPWWPRASRARTTSPTTAPRIKPLPRRRTEWATRPWSRAIFTRARWTWPTTVNRITRPTTRTWRGTRFPFTMVMCAKCDQLLPTKPVI